jgi:hypothetical protein
MARSILSVAAAMALALVQAGAVEAHHDGHGAHSYHYPHGHRFSGGYYYAGRHHSHWSRTVWDAASGRTLYFDPDQSIYYYWHEGDGCYYPRDYKPRAR